MNTDLPAVKRIVEADICRDGGSYLFCFDSDDGQWYEFFLKTCAFDPAATTSHHPPAIYRGSSNDGQLIHSLSWAEGKAFVANLNYENMRFHELVSIVLNEGQG